MPKVSLAEEKMFGQLLKMQLKKHGIMLTITVGQRKATSVLFGFKE
jgi:hypothetical protein